MSEDYIAIFEHPVTVSLMDLVLGHDMIHAMHLDQTATTKIHLVSIADGSFKTIETGIYF
jgi:carotenoid cleavage dioxygenase-like enzyme